MGDHQFGSFTQGIIDLLINTTGEFVTERYHIITTDYQVLERDGKVSELDQRTDALQVDFV